METLKQRLKRHEGLSLRLYKDAVGKHSIGYGRNLDDKGISESEAEAMLERDIDEAERALQGLTLDLSYTLWHIADTRKDVLVEMIFQLGLDGFLQFRKMINALENGDYNKAADEILNSKWARQTPSRCGELAKIMRKG